MATPIRREGTQVVCALPRSLSFVWRVCCWAMRNGHRRTATAAFAALRLLGCTQRLLQCGRSEA